MLVLFFVVFLYPRGEEPIALGFRVLRLVPRLTARPGGSGRRLRPEVAPRRKAPAEERERLTSRMQNAKCPSGGVTFFLERLDEWRTVADSGGPQHLNTSTP